MTTLFVIAWSAAFILTAVEEIFISLGRLRGILALAISTVGCLVMLPLGWDQIFYSLAAAFIGLASSMVAETVFTGKSDRLTRGLPSRIPPL